MSDEDAKLLHTTIDGKKAQVVFLDRDWQPVSPRSPDAIAARAIFDDGHTGFYKVEPPPDGED